MTLAETKLHGAFIIDPDLIPDERGFFAVCWSAADFAARGLNPSLAQCSVAFNTRSGTLRGMHFQTGATAQAKLVRCTMGAIFDVMIDLRPDSPSFRQWVGVELTAANHRMLYIPEGFAHGYLTLTANTEAFYQMSAPYDPSAAAGVRWDDPAFAINWPAEVEVINNRDRTYPDFEG
ncbi:MAG: dTDP-4-dehydrorhamnose 3,5-epimerase [Chloroflexi bacterium]|nr:dTDP-4-dehydrorhamnose 3,5-epimerase [Chloroflexota bacterium]